MNRGPDRPEHFPSRLLAVLTALFAFTGFARIEQAGASPVKIFIMAGQSNTQGHGEISPSTTQGTLGYITTPANDPTGRYQFLKDGANWAARGDVRVHYQRNVALGSGVDVGDLAPGFGASSAKTTIGPELGFGHVLGNALEEKVLLIKCSWGGKSLGVDFLPPSSENYPTPLVEGDKGFFYKRLLEIVASVTANIGSHVPGYSGEGYVISGFAWHQGWNDRVDNVLSASYQANMANFINDIRDDLGVPNLPFVIATTGMDGLSGYGYTAVEKAQLKMADAAAYPAFVGNVDVVDARGTYQGLDFWQPIPASPLDQGYHWNRNARTYLHIGLAMGEAMSLMAPGRVPYRLRSSGGTGGVTLDWKNGTQVPASVRVLRNGVEIAASVPANPPSFVDASAPVGVSNYELQFTMPGSPAQPLAISHSSNIAALQASDRINGIRLTWQNNLNYTAIRVKRNGTIIAAGLPGDATSFVDNSPTAGPVTYTVEPTDAGSTPAEVLINVSAAPRGTAVIHEPFDMTAATTLNGKPGGVGLDGKWGSGADVQVTAGSFTFGTLPTFGNRIIRTSSNGSCSINIGPSLSEAGLLDHGAQLWFSFLCPNPNNINVSPTLAIGNDALGSNTSVNNSGNAIGVRLNQGTTVQALAFLGGGAVATSSSQATLAASELALVVGKITWGATPAAVDTVEVYTPGTNLALDTPQSATAVMDQSTFSVLSIWGNGTAPNIDEIRFGATYADVIGQGIDTSGDLTAPAPATMSFATPPAAVSDSSISMTATTASDANGVQYRFHNTTRNTYSPWLDSPTFIDTGLAATTAYSYTVQARDKSVNQSTNTASSPLSATTLTPDTTAPPTPAFAAAPAPVSATEVTMTAIAVTDPQGSPVQYRFHNTTVGSNSGWQTGTTYNFTGLIPSTTYDFTVQARDTAAIPNESARSAPQSATTLGPTSGTWAFDADGTWSDSGKWTGNLIAVGSGATAFFTQNVTATRIISLDTPRTIGNITFTDSTTSSSDLTIAGANTLTLDVPAGSPVIDVTQSGRTLNISSVITGNKGLQKNGPGILTLAAANTYSGTTSVANGQLDLGSVSLAGINGGTGRNISVSTGAALKRGALDNTFLKRLVETANEITVMTGATANNLDFSSSTGANLPNAFLGNYAGNGAKAEYSGTITPASDAYRIGGKGSNGLLGIVGANKLTGSRGLIVGGTGGSGIRVNIAAAQNFTGDTVINTGARLSLGNNLALQNSALNVGSAGGNFSCAAGTNGGRISGETAAASPTFGGLIGSRGLLTVFSNSGGNNETNLASTAVTGFTLNPGTGKSCTYSGAIANFAPATTLTKTGQGTQILSGANTYSGATNVNQGTLALVGGSQASPITVAAGASLGFTLGSPTTSTSSVNLTNGTVKITGTVNNSSDYLLMTATTITGTPVLDPPIPGYQLQKASGNTQLKLVFVPYPAWATGGELFGADANGDGVKNGLAFLLGAASPNANALGLLPKATENAGGLVLTFSILNAANRGTARANVQWSHNLGVTDLWSNNVAAVPETTSVVNGVNFVITPNGTRNNVVATIPAGEAAGVRLFGRLEASE